MKDCQNEDSDDVHILVDIYFPSMYVIGVPCSLKFGFELSSNPHAELMVE